YKLGPAVDASGALRDGRAFRDTSAFVDMIAADDEKLARAFVAHLARYATGSEVSFADRAEIRRIVAQTKANGFGLRSLIHSLAQSPLFLSTAR
ncbi:MAG: DUF1585 domain-containing protein, partial [Opitutales bacterium]|nr:DUF1585 domain-containing protein [Opitutales bacterium]